MKHEKIERMTRTIETKIKNSKTELFDFEIELQILNMKKDFRIFGEHGHEYGTYINNIDELMDLDEKNTLKRIIDTENFIETERETLKILESTLKKIYDIKID